jgi:hypothetical protein
MCVKGVGSIISVTFLGGVAHSSGVLSDTSTADWSCSTQEHSISKSIVKQALQQLQKRSAMVQAALRLDLLERRGCNAR